MRIAPAAIGFWFAVIALFAGIAFLVATSNEDRRSLSNPFAAVHLAGSSAFQL